ncbi:MAG: type IV-A pilus assembly ATPase PilB [Gammaproteobacteria bacterium]|nr:type IV-A pilus assembly ATPase PilB [Gammaproteobacteria bacterium]MDP2140163.1 type IV-A pilus assembly ATPase PilB [Gammaproteobacteria bacterium]MDP2348039.1 type IV-A pilus assembly ATPase PilB [Gammaproteobacteria bacterium]
MPTTLSGLAKRLVTDGLLTQPQAEDALRLARRDKIPFVAHLVKHKIADSHRIAMAASEEFGAPLLDLSVFDLQLCPRDLVDPKLLRKHRVLPLSRRANRLYLAASDPTNINAFDEIKFHTGLTTDIIIVDEAVLSPAIDKIIDQLEGSDAMLGLLDDVDMESLNIELAQTEASGDDGPDAANETPIVRFVNKILLDAIRIGASDIHVEPYEKSYRIRFRTDGILKETARPPLNIANRIASRLKIMSQMDISERRLPQDGRIKMKLSHTRAIDFRVNTLPTLWGEKLVLRILDPSSAQMGIDALGYEDDQKQLFLHALNQSQGLILVTGPTGSGKTVSLYTGLNILNTPETNISTAEDPVEINLEGINQVPVNNRIGLSFATALRAFLRQDPDVIMVGEIRDLETAEIAIKAAQTGHLVLSTLHTNSAPETLTRLRNMGIPSFNLATSVSLIIAQRLCRRLCNHCKAPLKLPDSVLLEAGFTEAQLPNVHLFSPVGCEACNGGYKGRVGIYEVVPVTNGISRIIMHDGNSIEIADQAQKEGFNNLRQSALVKVAQGLTSLEEANRVT